MSNAAVGTGFIQHVILHIMIERFVCECISLKCHCYRVFSKTKECRGTVARNEIALRQIGDGARSETRAQTESPEQRFFRQGLVVARHRCRLL